MIAPSVQAQTICAVFCRSESVASTESVHCTSAARVPAFASADGAEFLGAPGAEPAVLPRDAEGGVVGVVAGEVADAGGDIEAHPMEKIAPATVSFVVTRNREPPIRVMSCRR